MTFDEATARFRDDKIRELAEQPDGLRFLKLKSLSRREHLDKLFVLAKITPSASGIRALFREAFDTPSLNMQIIDQAISAIYQAERSERLAREPALISQLYKLDVFNWGGLHQNSLEKTIVDNYVKKISDFDVLSEKIENEIHHSMRGYVLCSWFNHWTSIIIEDVFRDHSVVLPAVGLVKKIDFFIRDVPFDLKVTYLPEGFIKDKRRADDIRPELTLLKQLARRNEIHFDTDLSESGLREDLWAKHRDHPSNESQTLIQQLKQYRVDLLGACQADSTELIVWLYENQGARRFDASNRLFLVLVDTDSFFDSWKLKRAKPLLDQSVHQYLDAVQSSPGRQIDFLWEGTTYRVVSDVVFVVHP